VPVDPDGGAWWSRSAEVVAIGLIALVVGGLLGYLIGHANAPTRTRIVSSGTTGGVVATVPPTTAGVAGGHKPGGGGTRQVVASVKTVSAPASTVTTAKTVARTIAVAKPPTTVAVSKTTTVTSQRTVAAKPKTVTTRTTVAAPPKTVTTSKTVVTPTTTTATVAVTHTLAVTHTTTDTATTTQTVATPAPGSATSSSTTSAPGSPQNFTGSNTQNLGTITVSSPSQLHWSCPGCASSTFMITNGSTDAHPIGVNTPNATSGQAAVQPGTYTNVTVQGTGSWTIAITPGG
jgi:hypothetical protein